MGAHGVKGDVRVCSFTEKPEALFRFEGLMDGEGRQVVLKKKGVAKGAFVASVEIRLVGKNDPSPAKSKALRCNAGILRPLPQGEKGLIADRDEAEALKGTELFIERSALPPLGKRMFYEADLVGLKALDKGGKAYGKVLALHEFGAGAFLEIQPVKKASFMLPFNDDFVPEVNVKEDYVTIVVPDGWLDER